MKRILLLSILTISLGGVWFFLSSNTVGVYGIYSSGGFANANGQDRTGSPLSGGATCTQCHGQANANTTIAVTLRDASSNVVTSYIGGETYIVDFQVSNSNYSLFGFQSVALRSDNSQAGNFSSVLTPQSQISTIGARQYPEQQSQSSTGLFRFTWVAPASGAGNITLYAMGNAVNGSGTAGDQPSLPVSILITEQITTSIAYESSEICADNASIFPIITGSQNGSFSAFPAGLVINTSTGEIDPSESVVGTYTITYAYADGSVAETLTINPVYTILNAASICNNDSIFLAGEWQKNPGLYTSSFQSVAGCDSTVSTDLTVTTPTVGTASLGMTITADAVGAQYQWLDCEDNFSVIAGEINQSFTASNNGFYAVAVTENGCTDTSDCVLVGNVTIESHVHKQMSIFPNPTDGMVTIKGLTKEATLRVFNSAGQLILSREINTENYKLDLTSEQRGVYVIELLSEEGTHYKKLTLF